MRRLLSAPWVLPVEGPPIPDGALLVADGRIKAVGPRSALRGAAADAPEEAFPGAALLPGLVDAHAHLAKKGGDHFTGGIEAAEQNARAALAAGVGLVLDKGWSDLTVTGLIDLLVPGERPEIEAAGIIRSRGLIFTRPNNPVATPAAAPYGAMTVLAPWPAAAWAKASPIRSSGKRAVISRLTPSFGMSASARRNAVPRPNTPPILSSR